MNGLQVNQKLESAQDVNQSFGMLKKCSGCKEIKSVEEFYPDKRDRSGFRPRCKECVKEWYKKNIKKCRESNRRSRLKNYAVLREKAREWQKNNSERVRELHRIWNEKNPEKRKAIFRKANNKRYSTPKGQLNRNISSAILIALQGNKRGRGWESLVDYTVEQLKKHLEKKFKAGMTWENYGKNGWHIDHIIPISVFNFEKPEDDDFKRCWALKNLRPLWAKENIKKQNKINKPFQPRLMFK